MAGMGAGDGALRETKPCHWVGKLFLLLGLKELRLCGGAEPMGLSGVLTSGVNGKLRQAMTLLGVAPADRWAGTLMNMAVVPSGT